jgi:peptidyl-prolyl cis-trans isomerase SurA
MAKSKLDTIRSKIIAGTLVFNEAATKYSDDETAKFTGPCLTNREGATRITIDLLDKDMVVLISKMKVGEFSQPQSFADEQGKKGVRIVQLKSRSEPHRMNLRDDYSKISNFALEEKKSKTLEKWIKDKLPTYYIMVDAETGRDCPQVQRFATAK